MRDNQLNTKPLEGKPLNLKYVSDTIGDSWKQWKPGDVVTINAQTGTGKTTFITGNKELSGLIDTLKEGEKLIYFCNRIALKRQIKLDLMVKYNIAPPHKVDKKGKPILDKNKKYLIDFKKLDNEVTRIKNIVISSYHAIAESEKEKEYLHKKDISNLDQYKYIVADEAHWILTDSSFVNKTNFVFRKLIEEKYTNSVLIYISATIDEILPPIKTKFELNQGWNVEENKLHIYTTGIDYSYLNPKYFISNKDIVNTIINDKDSDDKWIIFVTGKLMGEKIKEELNEKGISSKFICSGSKDKEFENIINGNRFDCKVLVSTKVIDNGINIKDPQVKNIVVMSYDRTTLIQEIGRVRINIGNQPSINLYIKSMGKTSFQRLADQYQSKFSAIELFRENIEEFQNKYNTKVEKAPKDIFYLHNDNQWIINRMGHARLLKDDDFAQQMIEAFTEKKDKFAYVKEQLRWLELEETFDPCNLIVDIADVEEVNDLQTYLENNIGRLYLAEDKKELIDAIDLTDSRGRKQKTPSLIKEYLEENFSLTLKSDCETSRVINGMKKKFKHCWKIRKII